MKTVVIDYGAGNLRSAAKALERAARESGANETVSVEGTAAAVRAADRIVLPGVGAFADCMAGVMRVAGLREALEDCVIRARRPFLGICVGMQLMAERGLEFGVHEGFGWITGEITHLEPKDPALKVPHMGWNQLDIPSTDHPLLSGLGGAEKPYAYFVHSYHLTGADPRQVLATTDYGGPVTAIVAEGNLVGTQFHPEKSQRAGLRLLANFLQWRP
jgi:glutamine amidotransferase